MHLMDLFSKDAWRENWRYGFIKSKGIGVPRNPNFGLLFDTKKALGFAGLELTSFRRTYNASMSFIELPYFSEDTTHPESIAVRK